jgi:4-aminobutyrate aminotransferase-like enzyme
MTYHVDRFYAAVAMLAGDGHIKQRLIRAYQDNLSDIDADELPVAIQEPFADLRRQMYGVAPANGEGPIRATVRKMSGGEAGECGVKILALYTEMLRQLDDVQGTLPVSNDDQPVVPPFLVKSVS